MLTANFGSRFYVGNNPQVESKKVSWAIFPNPVGEKMMIYFPEFKAGNKGSIFNALGQKVMSFSINRQQEEVSISGLPAGIYIVKIGGESRRVVKE